MSATGVVGPVSQEWRGDTLAEDASSVDTVLVVDNAGDFSEDAATVPRYLMAGGESTPRQYVDVDDDTNTVTLAAPVGGTGFGASLPLVLWDPTVGDSGSQVVEYVAKVRLDDGSGDVAAVIPHDMIPTSDVFGLEGATVSIDQDDDEGDWYVANVLGREPVVAGRFIPPSTLPEPEGPTDPPESSPTLSVTGSKDAITVVAHGIVDPTTILDYYMDGVLIESTRSTIYVARTDSSANPLVENVTYLFHVVARNDVGSAAPSADVAGSLNPDVDSETILAIVRSGFVLAGEVQVGNIRITPGTGAPGDADYDPGGIVIPLSSGGEIRLPADGSQAIIEAMIRTGDLTVNGGLSINGITNYLNGKVFLASGTANPTQALGIDYTAYPRTARFVDTANVAQQSRGLAKNSAGRWATINYLTGSEKLLLIIDPTSLEEVGSVHSDDAVLDFRSVCSIGTTFYVLGQRWNSTVAKNEWRIHRYNTDGDFIDGRFILDQDGDRISTTITFSDGAIAADPDGTHVWVAKTAVNSTFHFYQYTTTGSSTTDHASTSNAALSKFLSGGMYVGNADFGAKRIVIQGLAYGASGNWVFDLTTGAVDRVLNPVTTQHWGSTWPRGLYWDGTRFITANVDNQGIFLSELGTHGDTTVYGQYTWYDSNATGGNKESAPSPVASRVIPKRQWPVLVVPSPPDSGAGDDAADAVRVYLDTDSTTKLYTTVTTGQAATLTATVLTGTGAAPPSSSTFTASSATGEIASADGVTIRLKGDGSWQLGSMHGNADGTADVSDGAVTQTSPFTTDATLKRFGDMVFLSGSFSRASGSSTSFTKAGTIPLGYRPAVEKVLPGSVMFNSTISFQVALRTDGDVDIRMSAATTLGMFVSGVAWITADDPP